MRPIMSNETELYRLIRLGRWADAIDRAKIYPNEGTYADWSGNTALHYACYRDIPPPVDVVSDLLKIYPLATSLQNNKGDAPLHFACLYSSMDVVQILLKTNFASIGIKNNIGRTPLQLLCHIYSHEIAKALDTILLLPHQSSADDILMRSSETLKLVFSKAVLLIKAGYRRSVDDEPPTDGKSWRLLHASVGTSDTPFHFVKLAMKLHPEQIYEFDEDGSLPIHIAATTQANFCKNRIITALLMAHPAASAIPNQQGKRPLQLVVESGSRLEEGVETILNAFPEASTIRDEQTGLFPFMGAAAQGAHSCLDSVYCILRTLPELQRFLYLVTDKHSHQSNYGETSRCNSLNRHTNESSSKSKTDISELLRDTLKDMKF